MKMNIKYLTMLLACCLAFASCDEDLVSYEQVSLDAAPDGFFRVATPVISFAAGTPSYDYEFLIVPGTSGATKVNIFKQFTEAGTGNVSNEALLTTLDVPSGEAASTLTGSFNYTDLTDGLTLNGAALPSAETDVPIGSTWTLRIQGVDASGNDVGSDKNLPDEEIVVGVLSVYAGLYKPYETGYFRIGEESGLTDWTAEIIFIGSVNEEVFSHPGWWGPFDYTGSWGFRVDFTDFSITVPKQGEDPEVVQELFSGNFILTCQDDPGEFVNVPCAGSNVLIPDPGNPNEALAEHEIRLTYGYFTASGDENEGAREFYEYMTKIVD